MTRALLALLLVSSACGTRTARPGSDDVPWRRSGIDWSAPPAASAAAPWQAPAIGEAVLTNGVRILVIENHRLPIVSIAAIHMRAGGRADTPDVPLASAWLVSAHRRAPGIAALTADVIDEGTSIETTVATDHTTQQLVTTTSQLAASIMTMARVAADPPMDDATIMRVRDRRVAELALRRERTRTVAAQIFDRTVFANHAYRFPAEGLPETVARIRPDHVRTFQRAAYRPDALTIVLAGDVTLARARALIEPTFGRWPAASGPFEAVQPDPVVTPYTPELAYVDIKHADDAVVLVGRRTAAAAAPDQLAADVANAILGGDSGARLDRVLHSEKRYTFGSSSSFWRGRAAGSWAAAATFRAEVAVDGLRAMLAVIEAARATAPSAGDLALARRDLLGAAQLSFETTGGAVRAVERLVVHGLPLDWYATLESRLAALTAEDVQAAVADAWRDLSIVVVGDWAQLGSGLQSLGLTTVGYTADGNRVP